MDLSAALNEESDSAIDQREFWLAENGQGIVAMNHFVENNGLFTDGENFQVL